MIKNKCFLFLIYMCVLIFFTGCQEKFKTRDEYSKYINDADNGFSQTKVVNGVTINVTYKPSDLMVCQEIENKNYSTKQIDSVRAKYDKLLYFIVSYSKDNNEILTTIPASRSEFNEIQNRLTFRMNENVALVNNKRDTIPLLDFNFPRTYGMSKTTTVLFVFNKNDKIEDSNELNFNLTDIGIGIGDLKFSYPTTILKKTAFNY
jgi:hypothetical protein